MSNAIVSNPGWRDYWKADRRASCMPENEHTAQEIAATWQRWFGDCAGGSRILDIATGNGIVLTHAAAAGRALNRAFALTGVDLADIDPLRYVTSLEDDMRAARFIGGVAAEQLPFEAGSFDAVVSQYGLEYADMSRALAEVARVLAPGGTLHWLAHSDASEVVVQNREQAREVEYLLAPRGPVHYMNTFVARQRRRKDMQYSINMLNESFAQAYEFCKTHPPAKVVQEVCSGFADIANRWQAFDPADLAQMLAQAQQRLVGHRARIESLLGAVLTPTRLQSVEACLTRAPWRNLTIAAVRVGEGPSEIGVHVRAERGGGS
ncbi:MAG TPA: class I SAM-dependent methyltransferase [Steroidobacteraceae bacterium]|nr:class I SAM-dependent methyltransferase [Steroidobacteraceae bacterium]